MIRLWLNMHQVCSATVFQALFQASNPQRSALGDAGLLIAAYPICQRSFQRLNSQSGMINRHAFGSPANHSPHTSHANNACYVLGSLSASAPSVQGHLACTITMCQALLSFMPAYQRTMYCRSGPRRLRYKGSPLASRMSSCHFLLLGHSLALFRRECCE